MIKHIPILYLTAVPKNTVIDGDNNYNAAHIMVYNHLPYWYEILNVKPSTEILSSKLIKE